MSDKRKGELRFNNTHTAADVAGGVLVVVVVLRGRVQGLQEGDVHVLQLEYWNDHH